MKEYVYQRLWESLSGRGTANGENGPSPDDRAAIIEILRETKRDLPDYWKTPPAVSR
jgi:hypothetical protein